MGQTQVGPSGQKWNLEMLLFRTFFLQKASIDGSLVIEGVCPLVSLLTLALEVAVVRSRSTKTEARTGSALKEASLVSWTTLPETAAVWVGKGNVLELTKLLTLGMLVVVRYVMVGVDVLGAVRNLASIVGKTILSGENTVRPS